MIKHNFLKNIFLKYEPKTVIQRNFKQFSSAKNLDIKTDEDSQFTHLSNNSNINYRDYGEFLSNCDKDYSKIIKAGAKANGNNSKSGM